MRLELEGHSKRAEVAQALADQRGKELDYAQKLADQRLKALAQLEGTNDALAMMLRDARTEVLAEVLSEVTNAIEQMVSEVKQS